ncbi:RimK family protein [Parahaliea sp. F7430]|uniref:RimK family protein n=1 Tax=Sediminihaliea albiluteola TaxID=2758564 RepID=A0A7W2TYI6_9GAMM|nr:RimK family protein [Sediminihaliea albiluteola]MBA6414325.1 RimK family protein [Sediminihaliea albiluteola]
MSQTLIVIDNHSDWAPYYPSDQVISFADYMNGQYPQGQTRTRVINLSRSFGYLSAGYYCSLLAEARGHKVIPSVRTLNDLSKRSLYRIHIDDFSQSVYKALKSADTSSEIPLMSYFGHTPDPRFHELSQKLFESFPCPILEITLRFRKQWEVSNLKPRSPKGLSEAEENDFATALDEFSRKVWRKQREQKTARYDLAILCDPDEAMPPSDKTALKRFVKAGKDLGIDVEIISQRDYLRLPEFDGLLIRTTTNIDHYTYRFAKKAESEGLVVIDDSSSILRCTNKIYLADLFRTHKVPSPKTVVLYRDQPGQLEALGEELGFPIVVKIPDGAFSKGVEKAANLSELRSISKRLFQRSTLLLAQEFLYTDFDWRIGILDRKPLYACRYYMVKDHWQIYRHGDKTDSGGFDTLPTFEVPPAVLDAALRATRPIGDGFYGVDIKESQGKGYVIEVNDNPSIDSGVEDKYLGQELYNIIMATLLKRMEAKRGH